MKTICPCCGLENCSVGDELDCLNKKLDESYNLIVELTNVAQHIGYTSCEDSEVIKKADKTVKNAKLWIGKNGCFEPLK